MEQQIRNLLKVVKWSSTDHRAQPTRHAWTLTNRSITKETGSRASKWMARCVVPSLQWVAMMKNLKSPFSSPAWPIVMEHLARTTTNKVAQVVNSRAPQARPLTAQLIQILLISEKILSSVSQLRRDLAGSSSLCFRCTPRR